MKNQSWLRKPDLAECDYDKRTIRIPTDGDTLPELSQIMHEGVHAACPALSEEAVEAIADSNSRLLWRLNWRKADD